MIKLDAFTRSYLETALWSSIDFDGTPLDSNWGIDDFSNEALERAILDCASFREIADKHLVGYDDSKTSHDFWLTRNRHGAGFWDGDYQDLDGKKLTRLSHDFGELNIYVADDKLYFG